MTLQWTPEASKAAAELMNEKSSLDYVLFTIPNPKKPEVVVASQGNGGRQAVFDLFCSEPSKVLFGAFVVSAVDEKGSVVSVRRKLVHVTFAGSQVGVMTKGKLNGWSGPFRDPFPGCATYLQLMGEDDLDDLQEGDLEATLMAAGGATRYDFSNQTLRGSLGLPETPAPAPAPAPIVATKKFKMPVTPKAAEPEPPKPAAAAPPKPSQPNLKQKALDKMRAHKEAMKRANSTNDQPKTTSPERPVLQPVTVQEKEPEPPAEEIKAPTLPTDMEGKQLIMLLSTQSGSNRQIHNTRSSQAILKSIGVEPTIIDGADPSSKKKRDKLFRVSQIRGNYPQFFVIDKNAMPQSDDEVDEDEDEDDKVVEQAQFFGGFDVLNEKKQAGTLAKEIGLGSDDLVPPEEDENNEEASHKKVILLISSMCNMKVMAEQNHAKAVIEGLGIDTQSEKLEVLDGCDQTLKERRNELWGVSGKRAIYPQLFTMDETSKEIEFVGDYENIMYLHDSGSLAQQIGMVV